MIDTELLALDTLRPLRRSEYDRLVALGVFADEKVELLYGQLVAMSPQGNPHAYVVSRLNRLLLPALLDRAEVRIQSPMAASEVSEPEPDVGVYPPGDYLVDHPNQALLLIEVADSSLRKDGGIKARLYAEAGVPEYWVVDVSRRVVHVHRQPLRGTYAKVTRHGQTDTLRPVRLPGIAVPVAAILPPARKRRSPRSGR